MVGRFLRWWTGQLAALIPPAWRAGGDRAGGVLLVDETVDGVALRLRLRGRVREIEDVSELPARLRRRLSRVLLRPLPRGVLSRDVELPAAAAADPRSAIELNLDRHVPFRVEDVHFAFALAPRRGPNQPLVARLAVVPRQRMERLLEPVAGLGLHPSHRLETAAEEPLGFVFEPPARSRAAARVFTGALVTLNVALLAFLVALPWQRQTETLAALESRLEQGRRAAEVVARLEEEVAAQRARIEFLAGERTRGSSMVLVIEELSRLLPDDSWLVALHVNERSIRLQGFSSRASSLIGVLQRSSLLGAARFGSPIVRDPASGKERFDLEVDVVRPEGGESGTARTVARAVQR